MLPVIIVNGKTYLESTGDKAVAFMKVCNEVAVTSGAHIGFAAQDLDLLAVGKVTTDATVYAQHVDPGKPGRNTGFVLAEHVAALGIKHTLLNHSEHKLQWEVLQNTVETCHQLGMTVVVCADTVAEAEKVATLKPAFVAVEPPELIGGDVSVSTANPEIIHQAKAAIGECQLLVGAGIKTGKDVRVALDLGAVGVLVASGVVLAENPKKVLEEFVSC